MNYKLLLLLLITHISFAQTNEGFLTEFLETERLDTTNKIETYSSFDFSTLWTQTESYKIIGIIGDEHQRVRIKLLSVKKNHAVKNQYEVVGKLSTNNDVTDFTGTIKILEIKEYTTLYYGVDNEYKNNDIKPQGILIAQYEFNEKVADKNSGVISGRLYTKWYITSDNKIKYNNLNNVSDGFMNNAFVGFRKNADKEVVCNWADYRVPTANQDFDIGAGEFSPSEKYHKYGWLNYYKAWVLSDIESKRIEMNEWWK